MGANASRGRDNQSLIDKLVNGNGSFPPDLERAMRLVDRGDYFEQKSARAYMDLAWRSGYIHLSAPSIYVAVLKHLDLAPGQHFLNVGSGSGYLNTIVGLILGYHGVNHGIELNRLIVDFAKERLHSFLKESDAPFERDFCIPQFIHGNIFDLVRPFGPVDSNRGRNGYLDRSSAENFNVGSECVNNMEQSESTATPSQYDALNRSSEPSSDEAELCSADEHSTSHERPNATSSDNDLMIEPPPLVDLEPKSIDNDDFNLLHWPMYDRIYVGAAIHNLSHLQSILRLLKIGGVLVAPVQDELVKIVRLSEDRIRRTDLLSVSFAPLILPVHGAWCNGLSPPGREIPSLLRLCGRVLRTTLRKLIEQRHSGIPILGRLEEVETDSETKKRRHSVDSSNTVDAPDQNSDPEQNTTNSSQIGTVRDTENNFHGDDGDEDDDNDAGAGIGATSSDSNHPPSEPSRARGTMAYFLRHLVRSWLASGEQHVTPQADITTHQNEIASSDTQADEPSRVFMLSLQPSADITDRSSEADTCEPRIQVRLSVASRLMRVLSCSENDSDDTEEVDANSENEENNQTSEEGEQPQDDGTHLEQTRRRRRRDNKTQPKLKYRPPSYRYRDEMKTILSDELHLPDFFIRDALIM